MAVYSLFQQLKGRVLRLSTDKNFSKLVKNSSALLTSNTIVSVLQFAQVIVLTRFLSPGGYGIFSLVTAYVLMVNQFVDVRVSEMTVRFGSEYLTKQDHQRVAVVVKLSYLIDAVTGGLAYLLVIGTATWAARAILHNDSLAELIQLYAIVLLISTVDNTSNAVLRIYDRFKWISVYGAVMSLLELGAMGIAVALGAGVKGVLIALIVKDLISATINSILAYKVLRQELGTRQVFLAPLKLVREQFGEIARLLWHTNLMAYFRMVNTKVDVLILGFFRPPAEVGLYKAARQLAALLGRVSDPFFSAILPDLSRLWQEKQFKSYKQLLRRSSLLLTLILVPAGIVMMFTSHYIVLIVSGQEFLAAVPIVNIGVWGFILGGIFFWTWPGAVSINRPAYGTRVGFGVVVTQIFFSLWLVPIWGAKGSILALVATYLVGQPILAWIIWKTVTENEINLS